MKKMIKEEQYTTSINVGTFRTRQEAEAQLDYLRKKYGFSEENSYVNGTTVTVEIEKSVTDDSYYYEMVDALKREKQNIMNRYKMVSENKLKKMISEKIKSVISEMDWKTAMNAYEKANAKGDPRAEKFKSYAQENFPFQYTSNPNHVCVNVDNGNTYGTARNNDVAVHVEPTTAGKDGEYSVKTYKDGRQIDHEFSNNPHERLKSVDPIAAKRYDDARDEFNNWKNGSYIYDKQNGWQLKESKNMGKNVVKINENELRKIVSEAIQRNLVKEGEEFIGDELQTIKNAVDSIKQKIAGGNMPGSGYDPTSDYFLSSKIEELEGIVNELLSDTWH